MTEPLRGIQRNASVKQLLLDPENPRLPESLRGGAQEDLAVSLEMGFDAFAVAQSMVSNGFFAGEPLLVVAGPGDTWTVVEGNRRLTALMGLTQDSVRREFTDPARWETLAANSPLTEESLIPVVEYPSREASHAEVARAHVVGKLPWRPFMQARFIAARVDVEGKTLAEVADLIGITKSKAADLYRDQAVARQAADLGLPSTEIERAFSVLTVALGNTKIRSHIGAPLGSQMKPGANPVPDEKAPELAEVVQWVFGGDSEPVINDSRQMSQLGNVIASDVGISALRAGATLEEAKQKVNQAGLDPRDRLLQRLRTAKNALLAASDDLSALVDDSEVAAAIEDAESAIEALRNIVNEAGAEL
jgi:hypothetical protein